MDLFTTYIYQPFFNILVGLYWLVGQVFPEPDMGIAVILFSVAVRLILLPIDMAGERSDEDKFKIAEKIKKIRSELVSDPVRLKEEEKKIMRQSPGAIISEIFSVIIQLIIILMLYRIFTTGLEGEDIPLLYKFMPSIQTPINLMFLGIYDLSHTNSTLNIIQSFMIALSEATHLYFSPVKPERKDFISLVIIFPVVCFIVFMFLPAGKKIFIITSLTFSITVRIIKQVLYWYYSLSHKDKLAIESETSTPPEAGQPPLSGPTAPVA